MMSCVDEERRFFKYEVTPKIWTISQDIIVFFLIFCLFFYLHTSSGGDDRAHEVAGLRKVTIFVNRWRSCCTTRTRCPPCSSLCSFWSLWPEPRPLRWPNWRAWDRPRSSVSSLGPSWSLPAEGPSLPRPRSLARHRRPLRPASPRC